METKINKRIVRIMLTFNYSNFEFSSELINDEGISVKEIEDEGKICQGLAESAVAEYKEFLEDAKKTETKDLKSKIAKKFEALKEDPKEIEKIASLPQYPSKKENK